MDESLKNSKRTENDLLKFTEQKRLLKELNKNISELNNICSNQSNYVTEYFLTLKKECNKKREETISLINSHYNELIHKIESNEKKVVLTKNLPSQNKSEVLMLYLNDWIKEYNIAYTNSNTASLPTSIQLETNLV
jgi:hypothetical protein